MGRNIDNYIQEYNDALYEQENPYEMWIKDNEGVRLVEKAVANNNTELEEPIVIFYERNGELSSNANEEYSVFFCENKDKSFAYADEDLIVDKKRKNPWFKPELSIDTIQSVNYFGSSFSVKKSVLLKFLNDTYNKNDNRFDFIRQANIEQDTGKYCRIGFLEQNYDAYWNIIRWLVNGYEGGHISKVLYHGYKEETITRNIIHNRYDLPENLLVSVIIPSKDNPDMLDKCLASIKENALHNSSQFEIIVVDNGSKEENRNKIEALKNIYQFSYIYKKMDFNFSKMCNIGASVAKGNVFIFMNDDITVRTEKWIDILTGQALRPLTGAVGAKLYYPDSSVIQHVGITNMGIGPAHKLGGVDDSGDNSTVSIYHGRNVADYNVYAVTAALLCITREKFYEISGFDEKLSVAYNDVNLCFDLFNRGYFNIVRNDVIMYHHESVSRGSDESPEKKKRLLKERAILYKNHPESQGNDPFYSKSLVQYRYDGEYNIGYMYPYEQLDCYSRVEYISEKLDISLPLATSLSRKVFRKGPILQFNVDLVEQVENIVNENVLNIEGWAGLTDIDEILYDRFLLLIDANDRASYYKISVFDKLREDAASVMVNQKYNKLLGFTCHIKRNSVNSGKYILGIMFTNRLNEKSVIYYNSEEPKIINVGEDF